MTRVTINDNLRGMLGDLSEPLELCDESGRVLARVTPVPDRSEYEAWEPPIGDEELRRRERSGKWYSTEEVLAHLKSLESR